MRKPRAWIAVLAAFAVCAGCGSHDFNDEKAKSVLESKPVNLDGEQISLTQAQLDCGVQNDLWESLSQVAQGYSAKITDKARALKFNDDIRVEQNYKHPFAQVRGEFPLQVDSIGAIRDGPDQGTKTVEAKAGVKIDHACFQAPLPIMGVKKGNFRDDIPPVFLFGLHDDGWHVEKLMH